MRWFLVRKDGVEFVRLPFGASLFHLFLVLLHHQDIAEVVSHPRLGAEQLLVHHSIISYGRTLIYGPRLISRCVCFPYVYSAHENRE
jgi:hypothetical protein